MPELPDVEIFKKSAGRAKGKQIVKVDVANADMLEKRKSAFIDYATNRTLRDTDRRGKYLLLGLSGGHHVVLHFGMTGVLEYVSDSKDAPDYTKCTFHFGNDHKLCYVSKRKLGSIGTTEDVDAFLEKSEVGKDALKATKKEFVKRMGDRRGMIKTALINQSAFSGIGNVYSDEILFQSGIHPRKKAGTLSQSDLEKLYDTMKDVLKTAIRNNANPSEMPDTFLINRRKEGKQCPRCGKSTIKKMTVSGRSSYYCPSCQKE